MANVLGELFSGIANAIREKTGETGTMKPNEFPAKISAIEAGGSQGVKICYVTFMSDDGTQEYGRKAVVEGDNCNNPIDKGVFDTPKKDSTAQYNYVFSGWSTVPNGGLDSNALNDVTSDRVVYANFAAVTRYYTVRFFDGGTLLHTEQVAYGSGSAYVAEKDREVFERWEPACVNITEDTDCYAVWQEKITFANATWSQLDEICESGQAADYFAIGDEKHFQKTGSTALVMRIVGINADVKADGSGNAGITVAVCREDRFAVYNSQYSSYNSDSWTSKGTLFQKNYISSLNSSFPDELVQIIKTVTKTTAFPITSTTAAYENTTETIFIPSFWELGLCGQDDRMCENTAQYPGFVKSDYLKLKYSNFGTPYDVFWYLRNSHMCAKTGESIGLSSGGTTQKTSGGIYTWYPCFCI